MLNSESISAIEQASGVLSFLTDINSLVLIITGVIIVYAVPIFISAVKSVMKMFFVVLLSLGLVGGIIAFAGAYAVSGGDMNDIKTATNMILKQDKKND